MNQGKKRIKTTKDIILSHTITYFNILNLCLAALIIISGQYKNMLFMGVVISNSLIGIIQELKVKKLVDSLTVMTASKARKITDEGEVEIDLDSICKGDKLKLSLGDQVPADMKVLESNGIEVNESMLTGESDSVRKMPGDTLYSGTYVVGGTCIGEVEKTGDESYANTLSQKAKTKRRATSQMQIAIKKIIKYVSFAIIPIGTVLYLTQRLVVKNTISDSLVNCVAGVLGMIPEGLVLLTSISFILGVGRLAKKKALVQEMEAIEALARADVLCLDKTGTITTGELRVEKIIPYSHEENAENELVNKLAALMYVNEDTNVTSHAIYGYLKEKKIGEEISSKFKCTNKIPFSSKRKYMGADIDEKTVKFGAYDVLLDDKNIIDEANSYANEGYRVLAFTEGDICKGLIVLSDVIKEDAVPIFEFFEEREVTIKIISGDNKSTVSAVAKKANIKNADKALGASEFSDDDEVFKKQVEENTIFARVSPEDKERIIKTLENNGHVVAMTGDGVNDVLALKEADCGIAMANGSSAAKQSAHIVLTDSDFSSMKDIVSEGRTIISNIERVSALYLTKTLYSIFLCVAFIIIRKDYPFIPIQLSLIGGCAIGIPSFVLAFERQDKAVSDGFLKHVLRKSLPAAIILTALLVVFKVNEDLFGINQKITSSFNMLAGGAVSFGVLVSVCTPMSRLRLGLCILCISLFAGALLLFPGFFGILPLFG